MRRAFQSYWWFLFPLVNQQRASYKGPQKARKFAASSNRFSFGRQREIKRCAPSYISARPQTAAMRLDDRPTDREPHAGALRLRGEERLENAVGLPLREPDPRITH